MGNAWQGGIRTVLFCSVPFCMYSTVQCCAGPVVSGSGSVSSPAPRAWHRAPHRVYLELQSCSQRGLPQTRGCLRVGAGCVGWCTGKFSAVARCMPERCAVSLSFVAAGPRCVRTCLGWCVAFVWGGDLFSRPGPVFSLLHILIDVSYRIDSVASAPPIAHRPSPITCLCSALLVTTTNLGTEKQSPRRLRNPLHRAANHHQFPSPLQPAKTHLPQFLGPLNYGACAEQARVCTVRLAFVSTVIA